MINKKIRNYLVVVLLVAVFLLSLVYFASFVSAQDVKYCCEKTTYGAWCQDAPQEECDSSYRKVATSCEAVSYCKLGCCYDSSEGLCMENTPQKVCDLAKGTWSDSKECEIAQCKLGCCVLGTQAAFVSLTRCKKLSSFYGLLTDFRTNINTELECISLASLSDEGACVFELDYIKTCKFTSRQACNTMKQNTKTENGTVTSNITFYKDYLCSAEELGTNYGLTKDTICVDGKDEVYFKDSHGNPANIYDASKINDKTYWNKIVKKEDSCNSGKSNINNKACGNCNYFLGSICKDYKKVSETKPTYGNNICKDLNCKSTTLDKAMKHGESWCDNENTALAGPDSVGSRYHRHLCMNGEEIIEPCADYRQEICIQDKITTAGGEFSQAACRVNRWQDCLSQTEKVDCTNTDKRDCIWAPLSIADIEVEYDGNEIVEDSIACFPEHAQGLKFWEEGESQGICSQADVQCVVTFEKTGLITGSKKCEENCECLEDSWLSEQLARCGAIGDCGTKVNFVGEKGNDDGYDITTEKADSDDDNGGLFGLHLVLSKLGITGKAVEVEEKKIEQEKV